MIIFQGLINISKENFGFKFSIQRLIENTKITCNICIAILLYLLYFRMNIKM